MKYLKYLYIFGFIVDRVIKYYAFGDSGQGSLNTNYVFGLFGLGWIGIVSIVIISVLIFRQIVLEGRGYIGGYVLLLGVLSNFFDRIYYGGVIDYLKILGIRFNIADVLIVVAVGYIFFRNRFYEKDFYSKT